ncbi:MAG: DNA polymerase IV [Anaerolineae bacterium]|nr:DNA polymerase IV [Anaerolineae bacterium]
MPDADNGDRSSDRPRAIVHLDLDAFFAAVEVLDDPSLRDKPLVVGGRPEERGVVATASYPARAFGIHSAMPTYRALELCPELIVVPPRHDVYRRHSRRVMSLLREAAPLVEQTSVDEAYLDLSDVVVEWEEAVERARALQQQVLEEAKLSASLGVAQNKLVAKVASDRDKPGGLTVVRPGEEAAFLAPLPVRVLWGIGAVTAERLGEMGVVTVGDLAQVPPEELVARFGKPGRAMVRHAQGIDNSPLVAEWEAKSVSQERTFVRDLRRLDALKRQLWRMCQGVSRRLRRADLAAGTIAIKMRYADFSTLTRQMSLMLPTDDEVEIYRVALILLERTWEPGRPVRLLGVAGHHLAPPPGQLSFL